MTLALAVLITVSMPHGTLTVTDRGIAFAGKALHTWQFSDIQQLTLTPSELRILMYDDSRRKLGRDREYKFDHLPPGAADRLYAILEPRLDQRFVSAVTPKDFQPLWQLPARLLRGLNGENGTLLVGAHHIVFTAPRAARVWRYSDIRTVSSSGPFDLTLTTFEKTGFARAGDRIIRLQLKQPLAPGAFDDLWRRLEEAHGLHTYQEQL